MPRDLSLKISMEDYSSSLLKTQRNSDLKQNQKCFLKKVKKKEEEIPKSRNTRRTSCRWERTPHKLYTERIGGPTHFTSSDKNSRRELGRGNIKKNNGGGGGGGREKGREDKKNSFHYRELSTLY